VGEAEIFILRRSAPQLEGSDELYTIVRDDETSLEKSFLPEGVVINSFALGADGPHTVGSKVIIGTNKGLYTSSSGGQGSFILTPLGDRFGSEINHVTADNLGNVFVIDSEANLFASEDNGVSFNPFPELPQRRASINDLGVYGSYPAVATNVGLYQYVREESNWVYSLIGTNVTDVETSSDSAFAATENAEDGTLSIYNSEGGREFSSYTGGLGQEFQYSIRGALPRNTGSVLLSYISADYHSLLDEFGIDSQNNFNNLLAAASLPSPGGGADVVILKINVGGPRITGLKQKGAKLEVTGADFKEGAKILVNGQPTGKTGFKSDTKLVGKKIISKLQAGDRVSVENPDGGRSNQLSWPGQ
jgi:hypothetical protein